MRTILLIKLIINTICATIIFFLGNLNTWPVLVIAAVIFFSQFLIAWGEDNEKTRLCFKIYLYRFLISLILTGVVVYIFATNDKTGLQISGLVILMACEYYFIIVDVLGRGFKDKSIQSE